MLRATVILQPPHPVHLGQTLGVLARGHQDPLFQRTGRGAEKQYWVSATYLSTGVLMRFDRQPSNLSQLKAQLMQPIRVRLWTRGTANALEAAVQALPHWLGFHDSWESFEASAAFTQLPQKLLSTHRYNPGLRLGATGQLTRHLVSAIAEQKVTGIEAMGGMRALIRERGVPVFDTGDTNQPQGMYFFPDASDILSVPSWSWHQFGFDKSRSQAILTYAARASSLEKLAATATAEHLASALNTLPGIGPWTIAETLQRTHGHPDAISVGDYHLAHLVGYALTGKRTDDPGMLRLLEPWRGNRARVIALIKVAGISEPRTALRLAPEDHRRI